MKCFKVSMVLIFMCFCSSVQAAVNCSGDIKRVYVTKVGDLVILGSWRNDYTKVCNVAIEWGGVKDSTCKAWLSIAEAAQISKTPVIVRYNLSSCSDIPTYTASPSPEYLMLSY